MKNIKIVISAIVLGIALTACGSGDETEKVVTTDVEEVFVEEDVALMTSTEKASYLVKQRAFCLKHPSLVVCQK